MRRCMVVAMALVLAACSSDSLTAPEPAAVPAPRSTVGSQELDSYAAAPCAAGIAQNLRDWRGTVGDPTAIIAGSAGDTSYVRVEFTAPAGYESYYDGVVWQEWYWLPSWGYCMATRSIGMPNPYE